MPTLYCPECGYNLTGLTENRCPECGIRFSVERLEEELGRADEVIRKIRIKMLLFPLLYAVLMPCWFGIPAGTTDYMSPFYWVILIILISVIPVLVPPIWTGWTLGRQYARARMILTPAEQAGQAARPDWFFALLFAIGQTVLMFIYLGLGMLLLVFFVTVMFFW